MFHLTRSYRITFNRDFYFVVDRILQETFAFISPIKTALIGSQPLTTVDSFLFILWPTTQGQFLAAGLQYHPFRPGRR
jgi:hypothetical protein